MARLAAIDCGTNSIRLLVADVTRHDDGSADLRDVHREMRIVRLGQGVDATGRLSAEALERTRLALADYTAICRRKGAERVRMVATSATRDASNRAEFFDMTREVLGVEAEVISGDEEARLSFTGAVGDLEPDDGPFVVTDIGGGSTEVVVGTWDGVRADIVGARSVDIGCVRITERCLTADPPTAEQIGAAAELADTALARVRGRAGRQGTHLGRRGRHDHHAVGGRAGARRVRRRAFPPLPALRRGDRPDRAAAARVDPRRARRDRLDPSGTGRRDRRRRPDHPGTRRQVRRVRGHHRAVGERARHLDGIVLSLL